MKLKSQDAKNYALTSSSRKQEKKANLRPDFFSTLKNLTKIILWKKYNKRRFENEKVLAVFCIYVNNAGYFSLGIKRWIGKGLKC